MSTAALHIVFAGGGTAGHLFPGLAVAAELAKLPSPPRITFAGGGKSFESKRVTEAGFEYFECACAPMPRGVGGWLRFATKNFAGKRAAKRFLRREIVNLVVGMGGYVSVPMARAAVSTRIPLVLMEQNAYPGKVTRWMANRAVLICAAFDEIRQHLDSVGPVRVTGNPVREGFKPRLKPRAMKSFEHRLLVLGGSGGAGSLNEQVPHALKKLRGSMTGWQVVHQTGSRDLDSTRQRYRELGMEDMATTVQFVENFPQVLRRADLAISRAGGTTLAELAAIGVPAVLIPFPDATDDHQLQNAEVFAAAGAARLINEQAVDGNLEDAMVATLAELVADADKRDQMAAAMRGLARLDAAWQVARMIYDLATQKGTPAIE